MFRLSRFLLFFILCLIQCDVASGQVYNSSSASPKDFRDPKPQVDPDHFRCIVVGDSQTTGPNANRIRTQMHGWDAHIVGELVTAGNASSGYMFNAGNSGIQSLSYRVVDMFAGWGDGGPDDFFASNGHEWACSGDILSSGSRIARVRLDFGKSNIDSPWNEQWGVGHDMIARIAIRTTPNTVPAIQVRPERGGTSATKLATTVQLNAQWGIQIIEQVIPSWIDPHAEQVGIGLYFPAGYIEQSGQKLDVIGVTFHRVDSSGQIEDGTFIGYQGRAAYRVWNHVEQLSQQSRIAMIKMMDPGYVVIMLGHNMEWAGFGVYEPGMLALVHLWEDAFVSLNRPRPQFIFISPWGIGTSLNQPYLNAVDRVNLRMSMLNRLDTNISLFKFYGGISPEIYDPAHYDMDAILVHPNDVPTARRIAFDIYQLLFE